MTNNSGGGVHTFNLQPINFQLFKGSCNQNQKVIEEMSSWAALTMLLGMKTTFYTEYRLSKYTGLCNHDRIVFDNYFYFGHL